MISFLVDQNFNQRIVTGLVRREPGLVIIHARDVGLDEAPDPEVLAWAAERDLVLLTHDRKTIPPFVKSRVSAGLPVPGVFLVNDTMPVGKAVEELQAALHCLSGDECRDLVYYFPLWTGSRRGGFVDADRHGAGRRGPWRGLVASDLRGRPSRP